MKINILSNPVTTTRQSDGNIEFVLSNKGNAFVTSCLYINDSTGVKYYLVQNKPYSGPLIQKLSLEKGSYLCSYAVQAHRDGALGPVYDSYLKISGKDESTTNGTLQKDYEHDSGSFTLNVV